MPKTSLDVVLPGSVEIEGGSKIPLAVGGTVALLLGAVAVATLPEDRGDKEADADDDEDRPGATSPPHVPRADATTSRPSLKDTTSQSPPVCETCLTSASHVTPATLTVYGCRLSDRLHDIALLGARCGLYAGKWESA
eukprot:1705113-Amphidinium_carterae.1